MSYGLLKVLHTGFAILSISGFVLRWTGHRRQRGWTGSRLARTLPHLNDTLLLLAGLWLAWRAGWLLVMPSWLIAKLVALLSYMVLGIVAMRTAGRQGSPYPRLSTMAFVLAVLSFAAMASMAISKSPLGHLSWLLR